MFVHKKYAARSPPRFATRPAPSCAATPVSSNFHGNAAHEWLEGWRPDLRCLAEAYCVPAAAGAAPVFSGLTGERIHSSVTKSRVCHKLTAASARTGARTAFARRVCILEFSARPAHWSNRKACAFARPVRGAALMRSSPRRAPIWFSTSCSRRAQTALFCIRT